MAKRRVVLEVEMEGEYLDPSNTINDFFREMVKQLTEQYPDASIKVHESTEYN